jgi:hypothetical protein
LDNFCRKGFTDCRTCWYMRGTIGARTASGYVQDANCTQRRMTGAMMLTLQSDLFGFTVSATDFAALPTASPACCRMSPAPSLAWTPLSRAKAPASPAFCCVAPAAPCPWPQAHISMPAPKYDAHVAIMSQQARHITLAKLST